jgi:hypothetical protein
MTPLALIQGFLKSSHSAQHRQIIPFAPFGAETRMKYKRTAPIGDFSPSSRAGHHRNRSIAFDDATKTN